MSDGSKTTSRPPYGHAESSRGSVNALNIQEVRDQILAHLSCNGNGKTITTPRIEFANGKTIHITREYYNNQIGELPYDPTDDVGSERLNKCIGKLFVTGDGFEILGMAGEEEVIINVYTKAYMVSNPDNPRTITRKKILTGGFPIDKN